MCCNSTRQGFTPDKDFMYVIYVCNTSVFCTSVSYNVRLASPSLIFSVVQKYYANELNDSGILF